MEARKYRQDLIFVANQIFVVRKDNDFSELFHTVLLRFRKFHTSGSLHISTEHLKQWNVMIRLCRKWSEFYDKLQFIAKLKQCNKSSHVWTFDVLLLFYFSSFFKLVLFVTLYLYDVLTAIYMAESCYWWKYNYWY